MRKISLTFYYWIVSVFFLIQIGFVFFMHFLVEPKIAEVIRGLVEISPDLKPPLVGVSQLANFYFTVGSNYSTIYVISILIISLLLLVMVVGLGVPRMRIISSSFLVLGVACEIAFVGCCVASLYSARQAARDAFFEKIPMERGQAPINRGNGG